MSVSFVGVSAGSVDSVTVIILDDDNVTVEFTMSESEVSESVGEVTLYISSDAPGTVDYTLHFAGVPQQWNS